MQIIKSWQDLSNPTSDIENPGIESQTSLGSNTYNQILLVLGVGGGLFFFFIYLYMRDASPSEGSFRPSEELPPLQYPDLYQWMGMLQSWYGICLFIYLSTLIESSILNYSLLSGSLFPTNHTFKYEKKTTTEISKPIRKRGDKLYWGKDKNAISLQLHLHITYLKKPTSITE